MFRIVCLIAAAMTCVVHQGAAAQSSRVTNSLASTTTANNSIKCTKYCARPHSADDFRTLSKQCADRSAKCKARAEKLETDLKEYSSRPQIGSKYPTRDQTLKDSISYYRMQSSYWSDLAGHYNGHVLKLESPTPKA